MTRRGALNTRRETGELRLRMLRGGMEGSPSNVPIRGPLRPG